MYFQTVNEFWLKRPLTKVIIKFKIFILKLKKKNLFVCFFVFLVGLNLLSLIHSPTNCFSHLLHPCGVLVRGQLEEYGVPEKTIGIMVKIFYKDVKCAVEDQGEIGERFYIKTGVKGGM